MNFVEVVILFFIALFIAALFSYGFRRSPRGGFWVFLFLLFLGAWAARYWLVPAGPLFFGFAWIPIFFFVLFFAVLIAAVSGDDSTTRSRIAEEERRVTGANADRATPAFAFGIFFWFLIIILLVAIAAGFMFT